MSSVKRALIFLTGNTVAQAASALSGFMLAHWLSVGDYALYSIMIALISAMAVLTKSGVHVGFSAILGRIWPDRVRAGEAARAAMKMRRRVSMILLPPILVVTGYMLWENNAAPWIVMVMLCLVLVVWWADMQTQIIDQILYFDRQTSRVQALDTLLALGRLGIFFLLHIVGWLGLVMAILLNALMTVARVPWISAWIRKFLPDQRFETRKEDLDEIWSGVKHQMPVTIFYVFQWQIILLFLTYFAGSAQIAGYGAIGRITQLLTPLEGFVYAFAVPVFAKEKKHIGRTLAFFVGLCAIPGLALVILSVVFPHALLLLVGPNYANLHMELILAAIVAMLMRTANAFRNLISHRGWLVCNRLMIPINLAWIGAAPFLFDLSTIAGALEFQMGFALGPIVSGLSDYFVARRKRTAIPETAGEDKT